MADDRSDCDAFNDVKNVVPELDVPSHSDPGERTRHVVSATNARELQRLAALTEILRGWIWETDAAHRFTYLSDSVTRYAGRPPEWHYGKTREELGNHNLNQEQYQNFRRQLDAREKLGPFDFVRFQNGVPMRMRTIGLPQFDAGGHFTGYCGVAFEVSGGNISGQSDRRGETRRKVARTATILEQSAPTPIPCVVLDVSTSGARLDVDASAVVPHHFKLLIDIDGSERQCELVWRRENGVGVRFCDEI